MINVKDGDPGEQRRKIPIRLDVQERFSEEVAPRVNLEEAAAVGEEAVE